MFVFLFTKNLLLLLSQSVS